MWIRQSGSRIPFGVVIVGGAEGTLQELEFVSCEPVTYGNQSETTAATILESRDLANRTKLLTWDTSSDMKAVKASRDCLSSALAAGSARNGRMGANECCILSAGEAFELLTSKRYLSPVGQSRREHLSLAVS